MNIDFFSISDSFEKIHISYDEICEIEHHISFNSLLGDYFRRLYEDTGKWTLLGEAERIEACSQFWHVDQYRESGISDVTYVSHCRSKFCLHCQKLLQASRLNRFISLLTEASLSHDLYHVVLTVPNVPGVKLKASRQLLFKSFSRLVRLFIGRDRIRDVDFSKYGFYAAMRNLEITYGKYGDDDFHPHLHCIFALRKGLKMDKHIVNDFSYDYGVCTTLFSDFEIFLQKLWRLIVDSERDKIYNYVAMTDALGDPLPKSHPDYGKFVSKPKKKNNKDGAVTLKALKSLELGYSVKVDKIEDDETDNRNAFIEVFKYSCKVTSEKSHLFTYDQFKCLYGALKGAHVMQGYCAWYHCQFDEMDESIDEFYRVFIAFVRQREIPLSRVMCFDDVKKSIEAKSSLFLTRKSLHKWFKTLSESERLSVESSLDGVKPYEPLFKDKKFYQVHWYSAFCHYLRARDNSDLFADIRENEASAQELNQPLILSAEQMSFFDSIF